MALANISPAINSGFNPLVLTYDQRGPGYLRESGGAPDIAAYELQEATQASASPGSSTASSPAFAATESSPRSCPPPPHFPQLAPPDTCIMYRAWIMKSDNY
jgi:hypothetical protein